MNRYYMHLLTAVAVLLPCSSGLLLTPPGQHHISTSSSHPGGVAAFTRSSSAGGRYGGSRLYSTTAPPTTRAPPLDLLAELDSEGLGLCHGILHASGVRRLSDVKTLTDLQIDTMGVDSFDRRNLRRVIDDLLVKDAVIQQQELSTLVDGAFDRRIPERFEVVPKQDFALEVISEEHDIFKGRLFTKEQCLQMSRMAEYHAYRGISTIGAGWTNELYTLTAQHMQCKEVPGFLSTTKPIFDQLRQELYNLFPGRIRQGSILYESDGEPHLVKYHGKAKGTEMHTDNSEYIYITLNVVLSADEDFSGGGTYIKAIDKTIHLQQGEMLIHLGDLEHAGADITGGVRNLLICFFACEWEDEKLNIAKVEEARDYVG
jgi:hypothetical protein